MSLFVDGICCCFWLLFSFFVVVVAAVVAAVVANLAFYCRCYGCFSRRQTRMKEVNFETHW